MFRKLWKTIKFIIIVVIVLICFPRSILPHKTSDQNQDDIENYLKLNEKETRLIEFKDDEESLKLKLIQLSIINDSRKKYKAGPVKLDILASRLANKMSREAAENDYIGHWNLAGEKPYHRYAFAGGYDHVSENTFGEWSSTKYVISAANISERMKSANNSFMSERAPNDGHKTNTIEKSHNYVGIGFCLTGKQFRYYEEYIDRYLEFDKIPKEVRVDEPFSITVKTNGLSFLYYMIIYRDKFPSAMTPAQIKRRGSYADFGDEDYQKIPAWDLSRYRNGTIYILPLKFNKEGLYYIQIFTDKKDMTGQSSLNTQGKTSQSGIVIKVNR